MTSLRTLALIFSILLTITLVSCTSDKQWIFINLEEEESNTLEIKEKILSLNDVLPIGLEYQDSVLFINLARSPQALMALSLEKKMLIDSFGNIGQGPEELLNPEFTTRTIDGYPALYDIHTKKMMNILYQGNNYLLNNISNFPAEIFPASDIALSPDYITGRDLQSPDSMFFIYNKKDKEKISIPFYPTLKNLKSRKDYFFAVRTAINQNKNKVIAVNYFMNLIHLYNLKGEHLRSLAFSKTPIPNINSKTKEINLEAEYTGIQALFPLKDYIYILIKTKNSPTKQNAILAKLDWQGTLIKSFIIHQNIIGGFCINENTSTLYAITQELDQDFLEIHNIVSYKID
ncbi:BF3164 family lipoprotein [Sphingobacterium sp. UT-1RO-CII-1]|uniref:BF3164 family lipoprotein n=1 Tax=Sphingobacterium sp. UT-1RO-CII-1 TaxID=2995225 RepID=UPI00227BFEB2|nr:BF3164 family lipoprotein [Sphingobacterium sp. UT-1RO-CII-1]MCY4778303.1 BF3164 family lipoprotein [Sphingobacterium sp. UT-1RO-CII-1]